MSQGSLNPKIKFLGQKVCSVGRERTDTQTDRQTHTKVTTEGTLSGFQDFVLQPIIKDRPNSFGSIYISPCQLSAGAFTSIGFVCNKVMVTVVWVTSVKSHIYHYRYMCEITCLRPLPLYVICVISQVPPQYNIIIACSGYIPRGFYIPQPPPPQPAVSSTSLCTVPCLNIASSCASN